MNPASPTWIREHKKHVIYKPNRFPGTVLYAQFSSSRGVIINVQVPQYLLNLDLQLWLMVMDKRIDIIFICSYSVPTCFQSLTKHSPSLLWIIWWWFSLGRSLITETARQGLFHWKYALCSQRTTLATSRSSESQLKHSKEKCPFLY